MSDEKKAVKEQSETDATCGASPPLSDLLSAISAAEERWGKGLVSVEIFADGSGFVCAPGRGTPDFQTMEECFKILGR